MLHKILATTLSLVVGCQLFAQSEMSVGSAIADILSNDKELVSEACTFLSTDRSDSTIMFATVALDGRLFAADTVAVAKSKSGSYSLLFDPSTSVSAEGLSEIKLSRKDRRILSPLSTFINLQSDDPKVRAEAYLTVASGKNHEDIALLEHIVESESDAKTKITATHSLYELYLNAGDEVQQSAAIEYIDKERDMYFATHMSAYIERSDISNANITQGKKLVKYYDMVTRNNNFYQNIFSGLSLGSILVLVSLGLSIVYGLAGIINMSHGEFLMIGAYTTYCIQQLFERFLPESMFDLAFFVSLPISFFVAALFGLVIERLVLRHLYSRPLESMLATLGISLILIQLARSIFGDLTTVKAPAILSGGITLGSGLILPYNRLFIIVLTILIFIGVYQLFQRTRLGVRIRAVTQNRNMSACAGISTKKIDMITFMLGSGLAGIAGCAITLIGNVVPNMGQTYIVDSFLVVVTGGVGKLVGCAVSGVGIGVISKFLEAGFEAVYGKVLILLLIIIFLQYRPKGLFADKGRIGDD
ncbi:MAG: urea ABC transporter permease subunit UrtB [Rikenellaceae bacterium]